MKYIAILAFVAIVISLGVALFFMMKSDSSGKSRNQKMALALAWRVGLSIALFASILLGWKLGWIQPNGISAGQ
ncbi:MAG: twin transmembrane helix small protein [Rhodoferax sp.]|uniref:twin transmembrane helix small protein n=1 Tax=Rhodoferax sp. TaxID=50421 RepID=UPI001401B205|nr:twin transmembrane helix small protein [Rhodoferax sp.]NDP38126.1 twin transmembrane helix small protein [Rhodoferax sp.]